MSNFLELVCVVLFDCTFLMLLTNKIFFLQVNCFFLSQNIDIHVHHLLAPIFTVRQIKKQKKLKGLLMFKFSMLTVKENEYTLREASPSNLFGPSCEKGSTLKEKNLLSKGANSLFLEHPFSEGDQ